MRNKTVRAEPIEAVQQAQGERCFSANACPGNGVGMLTRNKTGFEWPSCWRRVWVDHEAERCGATFQDVDGSLALLLFEALLAKVYEVVAAGESMKYTMRASLCAAAVLALGLSILLHRWR